MATRNDIANLLQMICSEYPEILRGLSDEQIEMKIDLWQEAFRGCDIKTLRAAAVDVIVESKTVPKLAHIAERVEYLTSPAEMTGEELWSELVEKSREADAEITMRYLEAEKTEEREIENIADGSNAERDRKRLEITARIRGDYMSACDAIRQGAFDSLPEEVRRYVVTPDRMMEFASVSETDLPKERGMFFKQLPEVREMVKRDRARQRLSAGR